MFFSKNINFSFPWPNYLYFVLLFTNFSCFLPPEQQGQCGARKYATHNLAAWHDSSCMQLRFAVTLSQRSGKRILVPVAYDPPSLAVSLSLSLSLVYPGSFSSSEAPPQPPAKTQLARPPNILKIDAASPRPFGSFVAV